MLIRMVVVLLLCIASTVSAQPYAFRGTTLGITLAEFRETAFPDKQEYGEAKVVCTGDLSMKDPGVIWAYLDPRGADQSMGLVKCAWARPPKATSGYDAEWRLSNIRVGPVAALQVFYHFLKDPTDGVIRLFKVDITGGNHIFNGGLLGLTERFGNPTHSREETVQNKAGAAFKNRTLTWDNGLSSIELRERWLRVDQSQLTYIHTALNNHYKAERQRIEGKPGDKL